MEEIPPQTGDIDMSDIEAKAVKKIGRGFMSVLKGIGEGLEAMAEAQARKDADYAELQEAVDAFNDKWYGYDSSRRLHLIPRSTITESSSTRTCGPSTGFWDCEDSDCIFHKAEKNRRGIGTPTRNFMSN
jgi:hypothetical protein